MHGALGGACRWGAAGIAIWLVAIVPAAAQTRPPAAAKNAPWVQHRTPWGDPDLQGMWPSGQMTGVPFERPERFGERAVLSDEELAQRVDQLERSYESFVIGAWGEPGKAQRQASLIVDPPNGRMPPLTAAGQKKSVTLRSSWQNIWFDNPKDFDTWDRCISRDRKSVV